MTSIQTWRRGRTLLPAAVLAAALLTMAACSTGELTSAGGDSSEAGAADQDMPAAVAPEDETAALEQSLAFQVDDANRTVASSANEGPAPAQAVSQKAIISTGNVALRSDDVEAARFDVRKILDRVRGEIAEEESSTDEKGRMTTSRLVLRVPAKEFAATVEALGQVATLIDSSVSNQDVTTKVIDTDVRVRVQRRSIQRIELLLDRAESIKDIVSIEAQLSRREADLSSLVQQQAHLADQTSMSTITVSVEQTTPQQKKKVEKKDDDGFLAGLSSGWDSLTTFGGGAATALGAALPWLVVLAVLGLLARPIVRRVRLQRAPVVAATPEA